MPMFYPSEKKKKCTGKKQIPGLFQTLLFFFSVSELCQPTMYAWQIDVYHLCRNFAGYTHSLTLVNLASSSALCILRLFCMHSKYRFGKNYCIWHPLLTSQFITVPNLSLELLSQSLSVL